MIKISKNIRKYYEKDIERMINILIYNILRNDDKNIKIVMKEDYEQMLRNKLASRNVSLEENIKIISEDEVYRIRKKSDLYILMYSHLLENKRRIVEIIDDNYIDIGKALSDDGDEYEEHSILIKNNRIDNYRYRWENRKIINNEEIIEWIIDTLEIAEKRAYLECPWYNSDAFDSFKAEITRAIDRGIDVVLRFGINCENDSRFTRTQDLIDNLVLEVGRVDNFKVIKTNTHIKQALIDNWYLHSSMNFGSNSLNYGNCPDENATINFIYRESEIQDIVKRFKENEK